MNKGHYLPEGQLMHKQIELLHDRYWLLGHMHYTNAVKIWPNALVYVMFRSPRERIVSHIYHLSRQHESFRGQSFDHTLKRNRYVYTFQANLMGYRPQLNNMLEIKKRIENLYYIGLTEQFEASLKLLRHQTGWKTQKNVSVNKGLYTNDEFKTDLEKIKLPDPIEQDIYEWAKAEFFKRCEAANIPTN